MPAYKYTLSNGRTLWYANFYYTDWMGNKKHICKRGFKTQREAKTYEEDFLYKQVVRCDIPFKALVGHYLEDVGHRLRSSTIENKRYIIDTKILPYFKKLKVNQIDTVKVRNWQNVLLEYKDENGEPYKATYLKTIHNQLSCIMNYAVRHYGLGVNPCHNAGSIGSSKAPEKNIWTPEQYDIFRNYLKTDTNRLVFDVLFWTGMRSGELLALTPADILPSKEINICKTYVTLRHGVEEYHDTKTPKSRRIINIPESLYSDLTKYIKMLYGIQPTDRIFLMGRSSLDKIMKETIKKSGLPKITPHDLRHSNASMLIHMGVNIVEISRRLGHESVKTTWDTYSHLYPDSDSMIAAKLDAMRFDVEKSNAHTKEEYVDNSSEKIIPIAKMYS